MEASELAVFMLAACGFGALLFYTGSPVVRVVTSIFARRALMGIAMGVTAVLIIRSPFGKRSGAHFNPAITLTYFLLGKVSGWDTVFYIASQFVGGALAVLIAARLLDGSLSDPSVNYVVTVPKAHGMTAAFAAEIFMAALLMTAVLRTSNSPRLASYTSYIVGALVAIYIFLFSSISGFSINPARTVSSGIVAGIWTGLWIYFTAPLLGMIAAAGIYLRSVGSRQVYCAKLDHDTDQPCPFFCRFAELKSTFVVILFLSVGAPSLLAQPRAHVSGLECPGITVSSLSSAVDFYTHVLAFRNVSEHEVAGESYEELEGVFGARMKVARLELGEECLELTEYLAPRGREIPPDSRSNDLWFQHIAIVVSDMDKAYAWLRAQHVRYVSSGPQQLPNWNKNAAGISAFYFKDPDGHALEVIHFPDDKGQIKWHRKTETLFLGIDHTAIVVADIERSMRFYRDLLNFKVVGSSENYGTQQEHLSNVFGAHLMIVSLRSDAGPGMELLQYLAPASGRPIPLDMGANDLVYWQTRLVVTDLETFVATLRSSGSHIVASGVVSLPNAELGFKKALLLKDPDGHSMELIQR